MNDLRQLRQAARAEAAPFHDGDQAFLGAQADERRAGLQHREREIAISRLRFHEHGSRREGGDLREGFLLPGVDTCDLQGGLAVQPFDDGFQK